MDSFTPTHPLTALRKKQICLNRFVPPANPEFQYTLIAEVENATTLSTTYWATKVATQEDSLAVAYLKDLQNTGLLPTIPYGTSEYLRLH